MRHRTGSSTPGRFWPGWPPRCELTDQRTDQTRTDRVLDVAAHPAPDDGHPHWTDRLFPREPDRHRGQPCCLHLLIRCRSARQYRDHSQRPSPPHRALPPMPHRPRLHRRFFPPRSHLDHRDGRPSRRQHHRSSRNHQETHEPTARPPCSNHAISVRHQQQMYCCQHPVRRRRRPARARVLVRRLGCLRPWPRPTVRPSQNRADRSSSTPAVLALPCCQQSSSNADSSRTAASSSAPSATWRS